MSVLSNVFKNPLPYVMLASSVALDVIAPFKLITLNLDELIHIVIPHCLFAIISTRAVFAPLLHVEGTFVAGSVMELINEKLGMNSTITHNFGINLLEGATLVLGAYGISNLYGFDLSLEYTSCVATSIAMKSFFLAPSQETTPTEPEHSPFVPVELGLGIGSHEGVF